MWEGVPASMWRSEDNLRASGLSFHYVSRGIKMRPTRCLYLLSHLTGQKKKTRLFLSSQRIKIISRKKKETREKYTYRVPAFHGRCLERERTHPEPVMAVPPWDRVTQPALSKWDNLLEGLYLHIPLSNNYEHPKGEPYTSILLQARGGLLQKGSPRCSSPRGD